jgi:hypothetical protein
MDRPKLEVADIFRRYGDAYRQQHGASLSSAQRRVMTAIEVCRTAALGGHLERCDCCNHERPCYDSCRDRHCPKCQSLARARIQLARSKNSWLSSSRSGVVLPHSKPFAVSQAPCSLPWPSPPQTPQYSASCSFLSLPTARPLDVDSHSPIKTHSTHTLQRFSPIHF